MSKIRLDEYLVQFGLTSDINLARSLIMQGRVYINQQKQTKAGTQVSLNGSDITITNPAHDYVSRGALKLIAALEYFNINPEGLVCLDIGSSTGGFTEVLLRRNAKRVFAVDVGYGELHYKLRSDPRVSVVERTNARYLTNEQINIPPDLIVCDASFIGLATVLSTPLTLAQTNCTLVALIKPQFEVAKGEVGQGGIVRDEELHKRVCAEVRAWLELHQHFKINGIIPSPILGAKGNKEFLIVGQRSKMSND
jgi:23S rRNA (cytidine1920-2'-O)/16S rRNA (cytidine1409-2'-O)-methyltransferase